MGNAAKQGDEYGRAVYKWIANPGSGAPVNLPSNWLDGVTPNHGEQQLAAAAGQHPESAEPYIVQWFTIDLPRVGNQAKGGTDEGYFSYSHGAHYLSARGPLLYFGMRSGRHKITEAMATVWRGDLAGWRILSTSGKGLHAVPGARFGDNADQRKQQEITFAWLDGKGPRIPKTLALAPDWLGLHTLILIAKAHAAGEPWAADWPNISAFIRGGTEHDLLPLKNPLVVERSERGHVAKFLSTEKMGQPSIWAMCDGDAVTYGIPEGATNYRTHPGVNVQTGPAPACPGGLGRIIRFPVAAWK